MGTKSKSHSREVMEDKKYILYDDGVYIKEAILNKAEVDILNYAFGLNGTKKKWKLDETVDRFKYFR